MQNDSAAEPISPLFQQLERRLGEVSENRKLQASADKGSREGLEENLTASEFRASGGTLVQAPSSAEMPVGVELVGHSKAGEDRDENWASEVENLIRTALNEVPNLSRSRAVTVTCMRTRCDASAQIYFNIPEFERSKSFEYLDSRRIQYSLGDANAMVADINVDRETGSFTISFDRLRAEPTAD